MQLRRIVWLAVFASLAPAGARADRSSGTWTGEVEVRGNYYWERSTRVIAPELTVRTESPSGVRVRGNYLVDTITSASIAAGAITDNRFTEIRHDVSLGAGYEFDLDGARLDLGLDGRYGFEPDYTSTGGTLGATLSLDQRTTLFRLGASYVHDVVGKKLRGANRSADGRDLSDRGTQGELDALVLNLGFEQVLTPRLVLTAGYDLGLLRGYQHNPYRTVAVDAGAPIDERHPDERTRHNGHVRLAYYIPSTRTALHALYRAYLDSWDIAALTPEARIYQEIGELVMVRLRYRYYTQTRAYFQQPGGYSPDDPYVTSDPKMTEFDSHLVGTMLLLHLDFLERSALDFAWRATLEFLFEYNFSSSSYGDGVIASAALRLPF